MRKISGLILFLIFSMTLSGMEGARPVTTADARDRASAFADAASVADRKGSVPVIIRLGVAHKPEGSLAGTAAVSRQRDSITAAQKSLISSLAGVKAENVKKFRSIPFIAMRTDAAGLELLKSNTMVSSIQIDKLSKPTLDMSVPLIGGNTAWSSGYTGSGVTAAILDTGVDSSHPMLSGKVMAEACYSTTDTSQYATTLCPNGQSSQTGTGAGINCSVAVDGCEHGTHVAGITAGSSATLNGVAKNANIIAVQIFSRFDDPESCGSNEPCVMCYDSDIIQGLEFVYSLRNTYTISSANMSLGGGRYNTYCDMDNLATKAVIDTLRAAGIATVIASGNEYYKNSISSPACISTAVSVGSVNNGKYGVADTVDDFSNSAQILNLLAPGSYITSSIPGGGTDTWAGTSMATPHVTGAWAVLKQAKPTATVDEILVALSTTGKSITDINGIAKPRIKVDSALTALIGSSGSTVEVTTPSLHKYDFNADGKADILWRNTSSGADAIWLMNGASMTGGGYATTVSDATWKIAGAGDFDGNGKADIMWRNTSSGANAIWLMNGTTTAGGGFITSVSDTNWKVAGVGDFDGDGKSDILWRNTSDGTNAIWLMNGTTTASGAVVTTMSALTYQAVGVGDFDGDGKSDILWRNYSDGTNTLWIMNGASVASSSSVTQVTDTKWQVMGAADFNADGKADILWKHSQTGAVSVWLMNGATLVSYGTANTVSDSVWKVEGVGDYDGDGKADVFWRNTTSGANAVWLMNGVTVSGGGFTTTVSDTTWKAYNCGG